MFISESFSNHVITKKREPNKTKNANLKIGTDLNRHIVKENVQVANTHKKMLNIVFCQDDCFGEKEKNQTLQGLLDTGWTITNSSRPNTSLGTPAPLGAYADQVINEVLVQTCLTVGPVGSQTHPVVYFLQSGMHN